MPLGTDFQPPSMTYEQWVNAVNEARSIMIDFAEKKKICSYGQLANKMRTVTFDEHFPLQFMLPKIIGQASLDEHENGRPLLSVIVVNDSDNEKRGRPGDGFFKLATRLGITVGDFDVYAMQEMNRVHQFWCQQ